MKDINECIKEIKLRGNAKIKARKRKAAAAALAVVVLVASAVPVLISVARYDSDDHPQDISSVLDDESFEEISAETTESEASKDSLPIFLHGEFDPAESLFTQDSQYESDPPEWYVSLGTLKMGTMQETGERIDSIEDLQDGILYPVCFRAYPQGSERFKEAVRLLKEERLAAMKETKNTILAFIAKYARAENHYFLEYYGGYYEYHEICEFIYNQIPHEYWPGQNAPEFEYICSISEQQVSELYYQKIVDFDKAAKKAAAEDMYKSFEAQGVSFYNKTAYFYHPETKELYYEKLFRVAFLTKEQLAALKVGAEYGVRAIIVCDELASPDNEPAYFSPNYIIMAEQFANT